MVRVGRISLILFSVSATTSIANTGVYIGAGFTVQLASTSKIQLVSENIWMTPSAPASPKIGDERPYPETSYHCRFLLRNLTTQPATIQVGMPVEYMHEEIQKQIGLPGASEAFARRYKFSVRDKTTTYQPRTARGKGTRDHDFSTFVWNMTFDAQESRELQIDYCVPMSFAGMSSAIDWSRDPREFDDGVSFLFDGALVVWFVYVTETGSSWSGPIESATFCVRSSPLDARAQREGFAVFGIDRGSHESTVPTYLPVQRFAMPQGWKQTADGIEWTFQDLKPGPEFVIRYYTMFFPRDASELQRKLDELGTSYQPVATAKTLMQIREALLTTFGMPAKSNAVRRFVENEMWYKPQPDFDLAKLTPEQRAMLAEIDDRIAKLPNAGEPKR